MTDQQLAFLLKYFTHRLKNAVKESEELLPEEAFEERQSLITNHSFETSPALDPIRSVVRELKKDIEELKK